MIRFGVLGSVQLRGKDGRDLRTVLAQPRRVALLAYIAMAGRGGARRDSLLAMFWPESDTSHARDALNQALRFLRRSLGEGVIVSLADEAVTTADDQLWCDATAFEQALDAGQAVSAQELYRGDLLEGFFVSGAPEFERWLDGERLRLRGRLARAAWALAEAAERDGNLRAAVPVARRAAGLVPYDEPTHRRLLELLDRAGDRAGAIQAHATFQRRLSEELGIGPAPETQALVAAIRGRNTPRTRVVDTAVVADAEELPKTNGGDGSGMAGNGASAAADRHAIALRSGPHLPRRRATLRGVLAAGALVALVGTFMLLRALGVAPAGSLLSAGTLRASEPILVADFRVSDADSALGGVITEALRTDLDQSTAITVVPTSRIASALWRMERPGDSRVDLPLAREIAQREGIRAIVHGDVTPLAGGSVLTVRLLAAESGDELASIRESVSGARDLLPALEKLTRALRTRIGESLRSVNASAPLEQVTTSSLEALKKYAEASRVLHDDADYAKAIRLLREAIALDTSFAMAYRKLAAMLNTTGLPRAERDSALARAYRYRHRLTERERLHTVAFYYFQGPGRDRAQSAAAYEDLLARYPTYIPALNDLAFIYLERREYARAETLLRRIPQVDSAQWNPNLVSALFEAGKTAAADSARVTAARVYPRAPQGFVVGVRLVHAAYGLDSVVRLVDAARAKPDAFTRSLATRWRAEVALARGRLSEALALLASAHAVDSARGTFVPALYDSVKAAWMDVWFRSNGRRAVRRLDAVLLVAPLRTVPALGELYFSVASVYALAGRPDKARAVLARYRAEVRDTAQLRVEEPASHEPLAEIALAERRPHDAVKEFRLAEMAPDGPAHECAVCTYVALARAFDQAEMPDSAITYFERYLNTPYSWRLRGGRLQVGVDAANLAVAYKRLGELYDARGDRQKAASYYAKFVDLWKTADPEFQPTVAEVRRRLTR